MKLHSLGAPPKEFPSADRISSRDDDEYASFSSESSTHTLCCTSWSSRASSSFQYMETSLEFVRKEELMWRVMRPRDQPFTDSDIEL